MSELAFANQVHDLDASDQDSGATKCLEAERRPDDAFDGAVDLLGEVVKVLRPAHLGGPVAVGLDAHDSGRVRAALVKGDLLGRAVQIGGLFEEPTGCGMVSLGTQQKVDGVAITVDRPVQALPPAAGLHVSFVHSQASTDRALAPAKPRRPHQQHLDQPAMQRRVTNEDSALGHHLLDVQKAQRTGRVPAHAHQYHFQRVVQSLAYPAQHFNHSCTFNCMS